MKKTLFCFSLVLLWSVPAFGSLVDDGDVKFKNGDYDGAITMAR